MRRIADRGPVYYEFEDDAGFAGVAHGVFTRIGGVSRAPWASLNVGSTVGDDPAAIETNKQRMYAALGVDADRVCTVWQVHGNETVVVDEPPAEPGWIAKADGLVTDRPGLALSMRFADCVPVLLADPVRRVIGLAHAGWRGTMVGAAPSVVQTMIARYGSRVEDIHAGIGPSIGPDDYEVGAEVAAAAEAAFGDTTGLIFREGDRLRLDLWEANRRALAACGVQHIEVAGISTAQHTDEFFSHRAERGQTGRFGAVMMLAD